MRILFLLFLAGSISTGCSGSDSGPQPVVSTAPSGDDWHRKVVFYELFVRSYQDSNADGIGDINGLIERLDYLAELGIGAIWLMPTYPSPLRDSGYDVADYRDVHPDYGRLAQFQTLIEQAHQRNIKVLLDLVINHSSDQHDWFQQSRQEPGGPKADWYIWEDEPGGECNEANYLFGDERWTFDPIRGQYYFHQFYPAQPDLNFRSDSLKQEFLDMVRYWLDMGVDGFRADVPHQYVENWPHCWHQPETYEFHRQLRAVLDEYPSRAMVAEACCTREEAIAHLGDGSHAFHLVFYFNAMYAMFRALRRGDPADLIETVDYAVEQSPPGGLHANTLGNHDIFRSATTIGQNPDVLKLAATAQLCLPGAPFVYYGEEIGMSDGSQIVVDFRDYARTPMQWDGSANAGFSATTPWLAITEDFRQTNVALELKNEDSLLNHYRHVISLRNLTPALHQGSFERVRGTAGSILAFWRQHAAGDRLVVLQFDPDQAAPVAISMPADWLGKGELNDVISGSIVGRVNDGTWTATLAASTGVVLRPVDLD